MSNTELKKVKGRVQNKHKTETEWLLDVYPNGDKTQDARTDAFIPLAGELIIYDPDSVDGLPRFKIGDPEDREGGRRNVDQLPFVDEELREQLALLQAQKAEGIVVNISGPNSHTLQNIYDLINENIGNPMGRTVIISTTGYTQSFGLIRFSFGGSNAKNVFFFNLIDFKSKQYSIEDLTVVTYSRFISNETVYPSQKIYQTKTDEALTTTDKTIVGAINELNTKFNEGGADGEDGREVELQKGTTHIQWRYVGDTAWTNLVALADLKGADGEDGQNGTNGKEVQLQKTSTHIQWRLTGGSWANLVALSDLKGADGSDGTNGTSITISNISESTADGGSNVVTFSDGKTLNVKNGTKGAKGDNGTSVTITNLSQNNDAGGTSMITFSDGKTLNIKNGANGGQGPTGKTGLAAIRGFASRYQVGSSINTGWSGTLNRQPEKGETFFTICQMRYFTIFEVTNVSSSNITIKSVYEYDLKGSDATVVVDSSFSNTSTNPVQNKVISAALGDISSSLENIITQTQAILGGN